MKEDMTAEVYLQKVLSQGTREDCPMRRTLELLSGKWRTHVIYELSKSHPAASESCKRPSPASRTPC